MKPKKAIQSWFILMAALLLTPWPVAYAYDSDSATVGRVAIEAAEASTAPEMTVFRGAIGSVSPGDLFFIHASDTNTDALGNLYLTNADELIQHYRYLILEVGVYFENDNQWKEVLGENGTASDTYLTLRNGQVSFIINSHARHRITIEGGSFYSHTVNTAEANMSPRFYVTVD